MKINNSLDIARWEKLPCVCNMDNETQCYPFVTCQHCKFKQSWESVPQENFTVIDLDQDEKEVTRTVKEITLIRGPDLQDVIGWIY
jgi:hypothetical protein|tara:strand:- start:36 stop:293 length:258 start_codon:yes stop_codon:yes gene_type:complete